MSSARKRIATCNEELRSLSINLSLDISLKDDFVYARSASISGFSNSPGKQDLSSSLSGSFNIVLNEAEFDASNLYCSFSVSMEYTGSSSFPDLSEAEYMVYLIPGEYSE